MIYNNSIRALINECSHRLAHSDGADPKRLKEVEMSISRWIIGLIVLGMFVAAGCTPRPEVQPAVDSALAAGAQQEKIVTLSLANPDGKGDYGGRHMIDFIRQVEARSDGSLIIEPIWQARDDSDIGGDAGVIQLVMNGKADLGLVRTRAWDTAGITFFQALQTPFLITNDALARAVATSNITPQMLGKLTEFGIVGLTLWPEDLMHPVSLLPGKALLSPDDFTALSIQSSPSSVSAALLRAFSANPTDGSTDIQGAESGLRGGEIPLETATSTGNITFYPEYKVLIANQAALASLSDRQVKILHQAAEATQRRAAAELSTEVLAGYAWCEAGGTIVLASEEQIAAFERAAQPVLDMIEQDPVSAEFISAILELKATTNPSLVARDCLPPGARQAGDTSEVPEGWSAEKPPNGIWQVTLTEDELFQKGLVPTRARELAGVYTLDLRRTGESEIFIFRGLSEEEQEKLRSTQVNPVSFSCQVKMVADENVVHFFNNTHCFIICMKIDYDLLFRLESDKLYIQVVSVRDSPYLEIKAIFEAKPWQLAKDTSGRK
jgi:TRAP-type C4-dicarboxylate transport system substrate-binding protein